MSSGRGSNSREGSPASSLRTTRHSGSIADNICAVELPGTRGGHARQQSIDSARASSGQLSEGESRAALCDKYVVVWESAVRLVSDAQPVLEDLLALDMYRGARALDPDAAAALLLTHAEILQADDNVLEMISLVQVSKSPSGCCARCAVVDCAHSTLSKRTCCASPRNVAVATFIYSTIPHEPAAQALDGLTEQLLHESQSLCAADVLPKYWPLSHWMRPLRFYSYTPLPTAADLGRHLKVTNDPYEQPSFASGSMHSRKRKVLRDAWVHDIALIAREDAEDYRQFLDKPFGTLLSMLPWCGCHEQYYKCLATPVQL